MHRPADENRLLMTKYVDAGDSAWETFNIYAAVDDWVSGRSPNLGLLVVTSSLQGERSRLFRDGSLPVADKVPIMVLFSTGQSSTSTLSYNQESSGNHRSICAFIFHQLSYILIFISIWLILNTYYHINNISITFINITFINIHQLYYILIFISILLILNIYCHINNINISFILTIMFISIWLIFWIVYSGTNNLNNDVDRKKRSLAAERECSLTDMYVNFDDIGWSSWIISPKGSKCESLSTGW